jgi:hypothetical protein
MGLAHLLTQWCRCCHALLLACDTHAAPPLHGRTYAQELTSPEQFATLPHDQQRCVLLGLWFALNWCRELVNCFSVQQRPDW